MADAKCACTKCSNPQCTCKHQVPAAGKCCCGDTCTCGPGCQCPPSCGCPGAKAKK